MKLSDFDFSLPDELIAQVPVPFRDQSRLMVVDRNAGSIQHDCFSNLPRYLADRPLMVFNNTKVIPAKLMGHKKHGGKIIEMLLVREISPALWEVLLKGLAKLKTGTELAFEGDSLTAVLVGKQDGRAILKFSCAGDLPSTLAGVARIPLPPYIRRNENDKDMSRLDRERYQTVYAENPGAIAAPTAGLHFTDELLAHIAGNCADMTFLTLHVGPGTFQPVRVENIADHRMAKERFVVSQIAWNRILEARSDNRKVLAVGTTTTRVLESIDLSTLANKDIYGETNRFIYPGYKFQVIDALLTNFHLPKSTLFMLVCAFGGKELIKRTYQTAIREKYRFFSYGDAMLLL